MIYLGKLHRWTSVEIYCRDQRLVILESCVLHSLAILGLCYTAVYFMYLSVIQNFGTTVLWSYSTVVATNIHYM